MKSLMATLLVLPTLEYQSSTLRAPSPRSFRWLVAMTIAFLLACLADAGPWWWATDAGYVTIEPPDSLLTRWLWLLDRHRAELHSIRLAGVAAAGLLIVLAWQHRRPPVRSRRVWLTSWVCIALVIIETASDWAFLRHVRITYCLHDDM